MQARSLTSLCLLDKQEWNNLTFSPFDDSIQNAHQSQSNIFIILLIRFTMGIHDTTLTLLFICGSIECIIFKLKENYRNPNFPAL